MRRLVDLDVYTLSEKLSDKIWCDYDNWPEKVQRTIGYQRKIVVQDDIKEYEMIINQLGPKLNAFISTTK